MEASNYCSGLGGQLATADTTAKETTVAKFIEANYATNGEILFFKFSMINRIKSSYGIIFKSGSSLKIIPTLIRIRFRRLVAGIKLSNTQKQR